MAGPRGHATPWARLAAPPGWHGSASKCGCTAPPAGSRWLPARGAAAAPGVSHLLAGLRVHVLLIVDNVDRVDNHRPASQLLARISQDLLRQRDSKHHCSARGTGNNPGCCAAQGRTLRLQMCAAGCARGWSCTSGTQPHELPAACLQGDARDDAGDGEAHVGGRVEGVKLDVPAAQGVGGLSSCL